MNGNTWSLCISITTEGNLLPIREAYEWKPTGPYHSVNNVGNLLPIREAYEWKPSFAPMDQKLYHLASNSWSVWMETNKARTSSVPPPVTLASNSWSVWMETFYPVAALKIGTRLLASNSWSVWMETPPYTSMAACLRGRACFQFVKRMNGNWNLDDLDQHQLLPQKLASNSWSVWMETITIFRRCWLRTSTCLLPIREAYEWKLDSFATLFCSFDDFILLPIREAYEWKLRKIKESITKFVLASNSWSVWMEKMCRVNSWIDPTIFLIPIS